VRSTAALSWTAEPATNSLLWTSDPWGVYVHVPFCRMLCTYCDFVKYRGLDEWYDQYVAAVLGEAEHWRSQCPPGQPVSLYLGGGTPSALGGERLAQLAGGLDERLGLGEAAERCLEVNPEDVDAALAAALLQAGFTRVSVGIQTFDNALLRKLGRLHTGDDAARAVRLLLDAGLPSVSGDLIYGLPRQSLDDWRATLERALTLGLHHLSCYALTIEPATPLGRQAARRRVTIPDDDTAADMYDFACARLRDAGYLHYEVSNWAPPGHQSRHNNLYWQGHDYLGLGAGAVGCIAGRRWWNERRVERYCERINSQGGAIADHEQLDAVTRARELLLLTLRTAEGLDLDRFATETGVALEERAAPFLDEWQRQGLIQLEGRRLRVPERRWGVLHSIVSELLVVLPERG